YLFLRHLAPLLRAHGIPLDAMRYRMTDCAEELLPSWRANPYLAEFVREGVLEFDLLEAGATQPATRGAGSPAGPLVVIANYVFDSLPQDVFVIQEGKIFEALVTTTAAEPAAQHPEPLSKLRLSYDNVVPPPERYEDAARNGILERYRTRLEGATVLLPTAALDTVEALAALSDGRMLVLAADKGYTQEDALALSLGPPAFEWHAPDCFSLMVNFDAIGKYFQTIGGEAMLPEKRSSSLHLCGFLRGRPGERFPATAAACRQAQAAFGPDDLFALLAWLNAQLESLSLPQVLAVLRLTHWDPVALMRLFPVIGRQVRGVTRERYDLREAVLKTWANHYPVDPGENVHAFHCGVILLELRFFEDAVSFFRASQQALGPSAATSYNLGLCSLGLGRPEEALAFMVEACRLDPGFEPARLSRLKLEGKG
ncbi:MAG TPA: SAM-dependent methyltransferase, partial [Terriglobales bacterium]|nr:SAM-dependent methyltransferase [Terriglobales bacterium]